MTTEIECAYLAGFIDGEGSIIAQRKVSSNYIGIALHIGQSTEDVLNWISARFPGNRTVNRNTNKPNARPNFRWYANGEKAYNVLKLTLPYLIVKREQALLAIEFQEMCTTQTGTRRSIEQITRAYEIADKIEKLNRRGK